jgi:predicted acyl esterase
MNRIALVSVALAVLVMSDAARAASPAARGSVEQVHVTSAAPGARVALVRHGRTVASQRAGSLGAVVFRRVAPGRGYRVRTKGSRTARLRVLPDRSAPAGTRLYDRRITANGYGYLTTRDGTKLAIHVRLPAGPGPYPTVVEYSGYGYANPAGGESSISQLLNLLGYAVVDVNMRGTGCSGGAFDYFEPLQALDGYDVIETVARQPWVLHGKVGMAGVSYGGISQLFVAARRPPSLAAIAPLSVIDNTATTLYPGGILNTGFALSWAKDRVHDARPASPRGGQAWALQRIRAGDRTCRANQASHTEAVDLLAKIRRNRYYMPRVADPLAPATFVHEIRAPTFLACQWTDEQTGGHCPTLASRFAGTDRKWFTFTNGTHIDALDPATFLRWFDFLELYVARRAPRLPAGMDGLAPLVFKSVFGVDGMTLPPDPIQAEPGFEAARAAFERQPPVRILFENGGVVPGAPVPAFERSFAGFPLPGTQARSWYLGPDGTLTDAPPATAGADDFSADRSARAATDFRGDTGSGLNGLWTATPSYAWTQNPAGTALSYVSAPLTADTAVVGAGALRAWIKATAKEVDLQATITEVRPDGRETFVQGGWLRTSARKLDAGKSTLLEPVPSLTRKDAKPLPGRRFARVDVPLYYQGHVYRTGSRIRVILAAPGGDQPVWSFGDTRPRGRATVTLARDAGHPSRLILPVVPGITAPTALPACPGLRGQPCRAYVPLVN